MKQLVRRNDIILDIGANIGPVSIALSCLAKEGRVYSFEPSRFNYTYLLQNIRINRINNIEPINYGVSDTNSETTLSYVEEFAGGSFTSDRGISEGIQETVNLVKLDDWVEKNKIDKD